MTKRIALFNHKGGVSKTTTTFNLGWVLAELGKTVLLVDGDPQCNLTGMVLGFNGPEELETFYDEHPGQNLYTALSPAFNSLPRPLEPVEAVEVSGRPGLFLLPGHISTAEYEVTLGIAQELSGSIQTLANLPGSISHLLDLTAAHIEADVVLIDMSPGLGALNQNLLTTSDFFLVPSSPDAFSLMALDSLGRVLPKWHAWAERAAALEVLQDAAYPFTQPDTKLLGTIVQKFRPRLGEPTKGFQEWIDRIDARVVGEFVPKLEEFGMFDESIFDDSSADGSYCLAQIADFNTLIARSQEHRKPVFALSDEELEHVGTVLTQTQASRDSFREIFEDLGAKLLLLADL